MEKNGEEKITRLLPALLEVTRVNALVIAELESRNIFCSSDVTRLNSIPDEMDRTMEFYKILITRVDGYKHLIECFRITKQTKALSILEESFSNETDSQQYSQMRESMKRPMDIEISTEISKEIEAKRQKFCIQERILLFNMRVREPSKLFTGRSKELTSLMESITNCGSTTVISQNSNITGLGGIGKTELAKKFIHSIDFSGHDPMFNCVIWINAENVTTAAKDFRTLAKDKLRIHTRNANGGEEDTQTVLEKIYSLLETRKTLIVFDNVESADLIEKYRPNEKQAKGKISVLITSQECILNFGSHIRLSGLEEEDAVEFVKKGLGVPTPCSPELEKQILRLVSRLEYFPLAIDQAIAYIKDQNTFENYGPQDYINELNLNAEHLLQRHLSGSQPLYKKTVYEIVAFALNKIKGDKWSGSTAINLVKLMAFMEPDNIPDSIFKQCFDKFALNNAFGLLQKYSMVTISPNKEDKTLSMFMHRLVQQVLRMMMSTNNENKRVLNQCLEIFQTENSINSLTVDHAISCWKLAKDYKDLIKKFSSLPSVITNVLIELARNNDAEKFANDQLAFFLESKIFTYKDNASLLVNLEIAIGVVLKNQYKLKECKEYLDSVFANAKKHLSESDPVMLRVQEKLGIILRKLLQFDQALNLYEKVYNEWKNKSNGKENENSLQVLLWIGELYRITKKYNDAENAFQIIIKEAEIDENFKDHVVIATAKQSLGLTKRHLGNSAGGLTELEEALQYAEQHLDKNHETLRVIKMNLGVCLHYSGRIKDALNVYQEVRQQYAITHGCDHKLTLQADMNIVECMIDLGLWDDLLTKAYEAFDGFRRAYGEDCYYTLSACSKVGMALCVLGKPKEALPILKNCLTLPNFLSRASALVIQNVKFYTALCLEKLGKPEEALAYLEEQIGFHVAGSSNVTEVNLRDSKMKQVYDRFKEKCKQHSDL